MGQRTWDRLFGLPVMQEVLVSDLRDARRILDADQEFRQLVDDLTADPNRQAEFLQLAGERIKGKPRHDLARVAVGALQEALRELEDPTKSEDDTECRPHASTASGHWIRAGLWVAVLVTSLLGLVWVSQARAMGRDYRASFPHWLEGHRYPAYKAERWPPYVDKLQEYLSVDGLRWFALVPALVWLIVQAKRRARRLGRRRPSLTMFVAVLAGLVATGCLFVGRHQLTVVRDMPRDQDWTVSSVIVHQEEAWTILLYANGGMLAMALLGLLVPLAALAGRPSGGRGSSAGRTPRGK